MKWLNRWRERLCRSLCPDLLWNEDMSLEIDRLLQRNLELEEHIKELEERNAFS